MSEPIKMQKRNQTILDHVSRHPIEFRLCSDEVFERVYAKTPNISITLSAWICHSINLCFMLNPMFLERLAYSKYFKDDYKIPIK